MPVLKEPKTLAELCRPDLAGNDYARKFNTKAKRARLLNAWDKHRSAGLSAESFELCHPQTFRKTAEDFPDEITPEKLQAIEARHKMFYERTGIDGMTGANPDFQATAWIFSMKAVCGWRDKPADEAGDDSPGQVINIHYPGAETTDDNDGED
jgi:hypothetical protein